MLEAKNHPNCFHINGSFDRFDLAVSHAVFYVTLTSLHHLIKELGAVVWVYIKTVGDEFCVSSSTFLYQYFVLGGQLYLGNS